MKVGEPKYSDTVDEGLVVSTDPPAGERVLEGHRRHHLGLARPRGGSPAQADRHHRRRGAGPDPQPQHGVRQGHQEVLRDRARGHRHRLRPGKSGTTLRFGTIVDLVVSKGRRPIPVGSWVGKSADDAERALEQRGLKVDVSHAVLRHRLRGRRDLPGPQGGTLFKGDTVKPWSSPSGPSWSRCRTSSRSGVDDATATLQGAGFNVDVQQAPGYIGLGYVFSMDPGAGTELPKGSTVTIYLV